MRIATIQTEFMKNEISLNVRFTQRLVLSLLYKFIFYFRTQTKVRFICIFIFFFFFFIVAFSFSLLLLFSFSARFLQLFTSICFHPSGEPFRHFACTGICTSGAATCARARAHTYTPSLSTGEYRKCVWPARGARDQILSARDCQSERASEREAPRAPVIKENYGAADNYRG